MTTIYSTDGTTVTSVHRNPPKGHWVQDTDTTGHYEPADISNGYYPLVEVARPSPDHTRSVVRDGDTFTEQWAHDPDLEAARLVAEADQTERDQVRNILGQFDTYLEIGSPTAAQTRTQVDRLTRAVRRLVRDQYGNA